MQLFDQEQVEALLYAWQAALAELQTRHTQVARVLESSPEQVAATLEGLSSLHAELQSIPRLQGDERLDRLAVLRGERLEKARHYQALFIDMQDLYADLADEVGAEALLQLEHANALLAASKQLRHLVAGDVSLGRLAEAVGRLDAIQDQLQRLSEPLQGVARALSEVGSEFLAPTRAGLETFRTLIRLVSCLLPSGWRQRDPLFDDDELDELLPALRAELEALQIQREALREWFLTDDPLGEDEIRHLREVLSNGGLLGWFRSEWRQARRRLRALAASPKASPRLLLSHLAELERYAASLRRFQRDQRYHQALGERFQGLETDLTTLETLRQWYRELRREFGVGFGARVALGEAVLALDEGTEKSVRSLVDRGILSRLDELLEDLNSLKSVFAPVDRLASPDTPLIGKEGMLSRLVAQVRDATRACGPLIDDNTLSLSQLGERIERLAQLHHMREAWNKADFDHRLFGGGLGLRPGVGVDNDAALAALEHTLHLAEVIEQRLHTRLLIERIHRMPDTDTFGELAMLDDRLGEALTSEQAGRKAFAQRVGLDQEAWTTRCGDDLEKLVERNRKALENLPMLDGWLQYLRQRDRLSGLGLAKIIEAAEQEKIQVDRIEAACQAGVHDLLAREILAEESELACFSGHAQEALKDQFREYDERPQAAAMRANRLADQPGQGPGRAQGRAGQRVQRTGDAGA